MVLTENNFDEASELVKLASSLIKCGDGSGSNQDVFQILIDYFSDFKPKQVVVDGNGKPNLYLEIGKSGPLLVFVGHSDVVSAGDFSKWNHLPFSGTYDDEYLYGRGSVDMRAAVAAFAVGLKLSAKDILKKIRVGFVVTSDEETTSLGAPAVLDFLAQDKEKISMCLVGEPSSRIKTGDKIRIGRRGGLSGHFVFSGVAGHVAYTRGDSNILNVAIEAANKLLSLKWEEDQLPWPAPNFHVTNFQSGTGENNTVPNKAEFKINIRFGPSISKELVVSRCEEALAEFGQFEVKWSTGFIPYFTTDEKIIQLVSKSIEQSTGLSPEIAVDGGTSDGRFFSSRGIPTIEVGSPAIGLHELNEAIKINDLENLSMIYRSLIKDISESGLLK